MNDRAITVSEAARRLKPFISRAGLYKWIERGEVEAERSPTGGRLMIRESEVVRILAWHEGIDPEVLQAKVDPDHQRFTQSDRQNAGRQP